MGLVFGLQPMSEQRISAELRQQVTERANGSCEYVLLYHPRRDRWDTHFAWSDDFTLIVGLTPTGRATEATLFLNRDGVVNLRRLIYTIGEHPPPIADMA